MENIKVIARPDGDLYPAIRVTKDTKFNYSNENVTQTLENLTFKSKTKVKGENYTSEYKTTIKLKENDVLVFEEKERGYILPVGQFVTVDEAIKELEEIREI